MKIAIDIDDTLTRYPARFRAVMKAFPDFVLLTGGITPNAAANRVSSKLKRIQQVAPLAPHVTPDRIIICLGKTVPEVARLKGEYCRDNKIDILFDDSQPFCDAVRQLSPNTMVLQVQR